jgi:hypothetical protein
MPSSSIQPSKALAMTTRVPANLIELAGTALFSVGLPLLLVSSVALVYLWRETFE